MIGQLDDLCTQFPFQCALSCLKRSLDTLKYTGEHCGHLHKYTVSFSVCTVLSQNKFGYTEIYW